MDRRRAWRLGCGFGLPDLLLMMLAWFALCPSGPRHSSYLSVLEESEFVMTWLNQDDLGCDPTEDSVVVDGQLYLRIQTTRPARVLVTYVETRDWTLDDLRRLREERPDLEGYWPEPGAENGGVRWIPRRLKR